MDTARGEEPERLVGGLDGIGSDPDAVRAKARLFQRLHQGPEVLVLANVWDLGSAALISRLPGVRALATTSAGMAAVHGLPDGERLSIDQLLATLAVLTRSVALPVSVDLESGYGSTPREVADTVASVVELGAVGVNLEDGAPDTAERLVAPQAHAERITAARTAADQAGVPVVVNARTDTYWLAAGPADRRFADTVRRLNRYQEAGADCVFVPGFPPVGPTVDEQRRMIGELVAATDGVPLNLLLRPDLPPIEELRRLGVRRVSAGSAVYRLAMAAARAAVVELLAGGRPAALGGAAELSYQELAAVLEAGEEP
ncbi:isocitrate lyase/PEP mutase family protein [Kitasatospora viridis]|uniref:2-methylisocitrate lyase-like PEP mutase family enzyme n=1 Tax=Kitasatospora viridis TaxID=281105 RepID=A0A561T7B2_9ACTN|nr:isocitrate lyase/phosphoenolpyruvate mutase family protein [Kitasatospora viridis]TWF82998.1 2-methylisocitrate lyase-like PEP mutase family enzyme [Kitasatospora viridis]